VACLGLGGRTAAVLPRPGVFAATLLSWRSSIGLFGRIFCPSRRDSRRCVKAFLSTRAFFSTYSRVETRQPPVLRPFSARTRTRTDQRHTLGSPRPGAGLRSPSQRQTVKVDAGSLATEFAQCHYEPLPRHGRYSVLRSERRWRPSCQFDTQGQDPPVPCFVGHQCHGRFGSVNVAGKGKHCPRHRSNASRLAYSALPGSDLPSGLDDFEVSMY